AERTGKVCPALAPIEALRRKGATLPSQFREIDAEFCEEVPAATGNFVIASGWPKMLARDERLGDGHTGLAGEVIVAGPGDLQGRTLAGGRRPRILDRQGQRLDGGRHRGMSQAVAALAPRRPDRE